MQQLQKSLTKWSNDWDSIQFNACQLAPYLLCHRVMLPHYSLSSCNFVTVPLNLQYNSDTSVLLHQTYNQRMS